jgi:cysteine rich repeat protein
MTRTTLATLLALLVLPAAALAQSQAPAPTTEKSEAREKVRTACAADIQKFCANIDRAKGARRACLEQNQASLSPACNAARTEREALRSKDKS